MAEACPVGSGVLGFRLGKFLNECNRLITTTTLHDGVMGSVKVV